MLNTIVGFGFALIFLFVISFSILFPLQNLHINTVIFLIFTWFIIIGIAYLMFKFNRFNLESYSKTILLDLGLITPDK